MKSYTKSEFDDLVCQKLYYIGCKTATYQEEQEEIEIKYLYEDDSKSFISENGTLYEIFNNYTKCKSIEVAYSPSKLKLYLLKSRTDLKGIYLTSLWSLLDHINSIKINACELVSSKNIELFIKKQILKLKIKKI